VAKKLLQELMPKKARFCVCFALCFLNKIKQTSGLLKEKSSAFSDAELFLRGQFSQILRGQISVDSRQKFVCRPINA